MTTDPSPLRPMVYTSLFVALIAMGAFIAVPIPVSPVPIVLQNMFVLLAGLVLGPAYGLACLSVYIFIGVAGLPVFAQARGGIGVVVGPTGGYLLGYLPAVFAVGALSRAFGQTLKGDVAALILGTLIIYAAGVPWLKVAAGLTWASALSLGMLPYLIGDALKIAAAVIIAGKIRPMAALTVSHAG